MERKTAKKAKEEAAEVVEDAAEEAAEVVDDAAEEAATGTAADRADVTIEQLPGGGTREYPTSKRRYS